MSEMTEVAVYRQSPTELNRKVTDDWFDAFGSIVKLAEYVADTEFVPEPMRRRPAAVAAAILTGREMGVPPMAALRLLHVIRGKVGQSAELMRAQVYRAGHEIRDVEVTDNRCILEGRRRGETEWTRATFSEADAKKAKIDLGNYPKDKLYARATSRLCKRKFSDAIAGLPTIDELEDGYEGEVVEIPMRVASEHGDAQMSARVMQRKPRQRKQQPAPAAAVTNAAEPASDIDEFPGTQAEVVDIEPPEPAKSPAEPAQAAHEVPVVYVPEEPPSAAMNRKMHALFREAGLADRDDRLTVTAAILGYQLDTSANLTKTEAMRIIETLDGWQQHHELEREITEILNAAALAAENPPTAEQEN